MYFLCGSRDHYVGPHRGEMLRAGSLCPVGDCKGRLRPAPEGDLDEERCRRCKRGVPIPSAEVGPVCSFCGVQTASAGQERSGALPEPVGV